MQVFELRGGAIQLRDHFAVALPCLPHLLSLMGREPLEVALRVLLFRLCASVQAFQPIEPLPEVPVEPFRFVRLRRTHALPSMRFCPARQSLYAASATGTLQERRTYFGGLAGRCQSSTVTWRARATVSLPAGTECVTVEPAAMVAPAPTVRGATRTLLEPVCASSRMVVTCLAAPS